MSNGVRFNELRSESKLQVDRFRISRSLLCPPRGCQTAGKELEYFLSRATHAPSPAIAGLKSWPFLWGPPFMLLGANPVVSSGLCRPQRNLGRKHPSHKQQQRQCLCLEKRPCEALRGLKGYEALLWLRIPNGLRKPYGAEKGLAEGLRGFDLCLFKMYVPPLLQIGSGAAR